jgi:HSP20 family protein
LGDVIPTWHRYPDLKPLAYLLRALSTRKLRSFREVKDMVLRRWEPFRELRQMQENMDRMWRSFSPGGGEAGDVENWDIPLDVVQQGDNIIVRASVPGVNPEDIDVSIENDVLTIKGQTREEREHQEGNYLMRERRAGSFYRALRLPDTLDSDHAQCHYENGVVSITFPRLESKQARRLHITSGQGSQGQIVEGQSSPEQSS